MSCKKGYFRVGPPKSWWTEVSEESPDDEFDSERLVPLVIDLMNGEAVMDVVRAMNFPLNPVEAPEIWMAAFKKHRYQLDRAAETTIRGQNKSSPKSYAGFINQKQLWQI